MELRRRDVLKLGLFSSAALMLPVERIARTKDAFGDRIATSKLPKPFSVGFDVPPVLAPAKVNRTYDCYRPAPERGRDPARPEDADLGLQRHHAGADDPRQARAARDRPPVQRAAGQAPTVNVLLLCGALLWAGRFTHTLP